MERLISMTEYVLRFDKPIGFYADKLDYQEGQSNAMSYVISYANLLSKKLELWMFVPCKFIEGVWVALEEPKNYNIWEDLHFNNGKNNGTIGFEEHLDFKEAKEKNIFKGCYLFDGWCLQFESGELFCSKESLKDYNVEDLVKYNLELTPTAKKQIGL